MIMLYGSQNFGYSSENSDRDWFKIVYPTWNDILMRKTINYEEKNSDGSITKVKDIRLIPDILMKSGFTDLQFLFAREMYDCQDLQWLFDNRQRLIRINLWKMYQSNSGMAIESLKIGRSKDIVRAYAWIKCLERVLNKAEFTMYNSNLAKLRAELDNNREEFKESVIQEVLVKIKELGPYFNAYRDRVDIEIKSELENEIVRLLSLRVK